MSAGDSDLDAIAVATVPCPRCEVGAGFPCVALSETGGPVQRADHPHEPRLLSVRAAYSLGYFDGIDRKTDEPTEQPLDSELLHEIIAAGRDA